MNMYSKSLNTSQTQALLLERLNFKYPNNTTEVEEDNTLIVRLPSTTVDTEFIISLYDDHGVVGCNGLDNESIDLVRELQGEVDDIYLHYV